MWKNDALDERVSLSPIDCGTTVVWPNPLDREVEHSWPVLAGDTVAWSPCDEIN